MIVVDLNPELIQLLNKDQLLDVISALTSLENKQKYNKIETYFTDTGPNARDNYPKQMELMRAGKAHRIRAFIGGNGSGKSIWQAVETYVHMSGRYPEWWDGHKFTYPISAWLCSKDAKSLRDGLQEILFGGIGDDDKGTGIIRREDLLDDNQQFQMWVMSGTSNCVGQFRVRHYTNGVFDGWSKCEFKTYDQGWESFQGPTRDWIGFDEEPEHGKVYAESIMRLRSKDGKPPGHFLATFTPTKGFRDTYLAFVPNGVYPEGGIHPNNKDKFTQRVGWSSSPHLSEEWKAATLEDLRLTDPGNIEARTEGYAACGSGRVYPIDEQFVVVPQQRIPSYWPRAYGMDPGQANFAMIWIAMDPNTGVKYIYDEYYKPGVTNYIVHIDACKARGGEWIGGGIDPHQGLKPMNSGESEHEYFLSNGLNLMSAKGDPTATIIRIRQMMDAGSLKIMDNCIGLIKEIRVYRFSADDPNKIEKNQEDHRCDALRYGIIAFDSMAQSYAEHQEEIRQSKNRDTDSDDGTRNSVTGY